jgi:NAD(P)-dependent dehydrogenase (short-subunit alcohol dehydrogenase family)
MWNWGSFFDWLLWLSGVVWRQWLESNIIMENFPNDSRASNSPDPDSAYAGIDATRVALITGAARRIGRAIALHLAERSWRIVVHHHRSQQAAEEVAADVRALGGEAVAIATDLAETEAVRQLIPRVVDAFGGPPSCLINNASLFLNDDITHLDAALWDLQLNVNLRAPVFLASMFAAHLPQGVEGNVINIIDQRVLKPTPEFFSYSVSKSALSWATTTMAQALSPRIRVNAIAPGPVLKSVHQTPEEFAVEQNSTLLKRGTTPDEIACAVQFLLETPSITGQMICLDGGQHLSR